MLHYVDVIFALRRHFVNWTQNLRQWHICACCLFPTSSPYSQPVIWHMVSHKLLSNPVTVQTIRWFAIMSCNTVLFTQSVFFLFWQSSSHELDHLYLNIHNTCMDLHTTWLGFINKPLGVVTVASTSCQLRLKLSIILLIHS